MKIVLLSAILLLATLAAAPPGAGSRVQDTGPPDTLIRRDGCVTSECHTSIKDHAYLHGPLYVDACDVCHTLEDVASHRYEPARGERGLCLFCHQLSEHTTVTRHAPIEAGDCLPCHSPHGGEGPELLRNQSYAESCEMCHFDATAGRPVVHGPVVAGACGACHEPHVSSQPRLLTVVGTELCLQCHVTLEERIASGAVAHEPVLEDCMICHDPHSSDEEMLLVATPEALCTGCHVEVRRVMGESACKHDAMTSDRACLSCHDPHVSDRPGLLRAEMTSLCFDCHDRELERPDGSIVADIKDLLESSLTLHEPVARRDCAACHSVHGADHDALLRETYSTGMYVPFEEDAYSLCFDCHDLQAVLLEETSEVTSFRNGRLNLHRVHVNRRDKGRSCNICHDPHASNSGHQLRDSVSFGPAMWSLSIGWRPRENGGSCNAGCHRPYEYNRVDPVIYPVDLAGEPDWSGGKYTPPPATDSGGEGPGGPPVAPPGRIEKREMKREVNQ